MATNIKHDGSRLKLTAPSGGVKSGDLVIIGGLVGIALGDAAAGATFVFQRRALASLSKPTTESWSEGDTIYWDATAKQATTNSNAGANTQIGSAGAAAATSDATGEVVIG